MRWFDRLLDTLRPARLDRELDEEVRFHLDMRTHGYEAEGASTEEARHRALRRFGSPLHVREQTRDVHLLAWLDGVRQDLWFGVRMIRRAPAVALAAVLSLGLGVGAATGVFGILDAVLLRNLPVREPGNLQVLRWWSAEWPRGVRVRGFVQDGSTGGSTSGSFPYEFVSQIERDASLRVQVAAYQKLPRATTTSRGAAGTARGAVVNGGYFAALGVRSAAGRLLSPTDDRADAPPAVVLSHRFWQQTFGGDPAAIGEVLAVNGHPFTVVGVAERRFFGPRPGEWLDFYVPLTAGVAADPDFREPGASPLTNPRFWCLQVMVRNLDASPSAALQARLDTLFARSIAATPAARLAKRPTILLTPGAQGYGFLNVEDARPVVILMGLVSLVLLVASANIASLLLARASARKQEAAMRMALGASRWRLARQQFTESLLLAVTGGAFGLLCARWFGDGLFALFRAGNDQLQIDTVLDWRVVLFHAGVTVIAGFLFGAAPAVSAMRAKPQTTTRAGGHVRSNWRRRLGLGRPLVSFQIAVAVVVLITAGLMVRSLTNLYGVPLGFDGDRLVLFEIDPVRAGFDGARRLSLLEGIRERLGRLPEVSSASWSDLALVSDSMSMSGITIPGRQTQPKGPCRLLAVGPAYHQTMRIPIVLGRSIDGRDGPTSPKVAVVSQAFARTYFPGTSPLGQVFGFDDAGNRPIQIVGVTADAKYARLRTAGAVPVAYLADTQQDSSGESTISVRASGSTAAAMRSIRSALREAYPSLPQIGMRSFSEQLGAHLAGEWMLSTLSSAFGILVLTLSAVGLYGIIAFAVARRTAELGIRIALGATRGAVWRLVLRDSAMVVLPGVALGLVAAISATGLLKAHIYGLTSTDPATVVGAALVILVVAVSATAVPARRAASIDPTLALRSE